MRKFKNFLDFRDSMSINIMSIYKIYTIICKTNLQYVQNIPK